MLYCFYRVCIFLVKIIPRSFVQGFAGFIGFLYYVFDKRKNLVINNIRDILGEKPLLILISLSLKLYINFAKNFADYFELFVRDFTFFEPLIDFSNLKEKLDEVLSEGKGIIFVSLHVGNWELAGHLLGSLGYRTHGIGLIQKDPRVEELYRKVREKGNVIVHPLSSGAFGVYKALKVNEIAAIVSDRDINHDGIPVNFLGKCVKFPAGAAFLSYKTGTRSFAACLVREKKKYKIIMSDEIKVDRNLKETEYIYNFVQQVAYFTEETIKKYPDQWFHFFDYTKEYSC